MQEFKDIPGTPTHWVVQGWSEPPRRPGPVWGSRSGQGGLYALEDLTEELRLACAPGAWIQGLAPPSTLVHWPGPE